MSNSFIQRGSICGAAMNKERQQRPKLRHGTLSVFKTVEPSLLDDDQAKDLPVRARSFSLS